MRVVVTGATGNVGSATVPALRARGAEVTGVVRRVPEHPPPRYEGVRWLSCDVAASDAGHRLREAMAGADAVVHLAWDVQDDRDPATMRRINVTGTRQVLDAALDAGVGAFVHASSVAAYSPGPKTQRVDESWPTGGIPTSIYSQHKVAAERLLDEVEARHPALRIARLRPGPILSARVGSEAIREFLSPVIPTRLLRPRLIPIVPAIGGLRFQAVHSHDVGEAFALAATREVRGPFNIAAEPVLDMQVVARLLHAVTVPLPGRLLRAITAATFHAHLQPAHPSWIDLFLAVPLMDLSRAQAELGWVPRFDGASALLAGVRGVAQHAGLPTPPLAPQASRAG